MDFADEVVLELTRHLEPEDWHSFMMVSSQCFRCGMDRQSGIDPSINDNSAIRWACRNGKVAAARVLLNGGRVDPSSQNNAAILFASRYGHTEIVSLLMEYVPPAGNVSPSIGGNNNALNDAISNGYTDVVKILIADPGVRETIKTQSDYILSPLNMACRYGKLDIVKLLVESGLVECSQHPVDWAISCGHDDIALYMIEAFQRIACDHDIWRIFQWAVAHGTTSTVKFFLDRHKDFGFSTLAGKLFDDMLIVAVGRGHSDVAEVILDKCRISTEALEESYHTAMAYRSTVQLPLLSSHIRRRLGEDISD